ncbi:cell surface protein [Campylobacter concisus]|uniref:cell surface protein n=1 Tax=Campylobacter concisus TaxID=199 RepID=UPI0018847194|nr:cell surface protein [Campylobacter concisus]MBE9852262.1 cell surface protein [Campylobacter concisus]
MITSINGLSNTPIQESTIQKENAKMSNEQEKALIDKLMHKPLVEVLPEFIDIDESKDNWITDAINKIDTMLSKKYDFTIEQRRALIAKYPEKMEELEISVLQGHMDWLLSNSVDGKPTISGLMVGIGTAEQEAELEDFMNSFPEDTMMSNDGARLFARADLSIEEFKKLYREDVEKTTKEHKEFLAKLHKEEQEYNANFVKEQSEKKFKPMQVKKKYETYDINKDQKFLYARELLNFKEKRGIDVLELMQKIDKKQILNKMA